MEITITATAPVSANLIRASFATRVGVGCGVWRGDDAHVGDTYQVELTLLDDLDVGRNTQLIAENQFSMSVADDVLLMIARVESFDPDSVALLRLGSDCVFLADVAGDPLSPGQWLRVSVPFEQIELWPFDSGSMTVRER